MIVDMPTDGDYHMVANTPLVDKAVLYHMLLYECNKDGSMIFSNVCFYSK